MSNVIHAEMFFANQRALATEDRAYKDYTSAIARAMAEEIVELQAEIDELRSTIEILEDSE